MHAWEAEGVQPDIQCVAKTLGSGYAAISAVMMNKKVADGIISGKTTFVNGKCALCPITRAFSSPSKSRQVTRTNSMF